LDHSIYSIGDTSPHGITLSDIPVARTTLLAVFLSAVLHNNCVCLGANCV